MILGVFGAPTHHFPITSCKECTLERNWGSRPRDPDFSFPSVFSLFLLSSVTHQKKMEVEETAQRWSWKANTEKRGMTSHYGVRAVWWCCMPAAPKIHPGAIAHPPSGRKITGGRVGCMHCLERSVWVPSCQPRIFIWSLQAQNVLRTSGLLIG